MSGSDFKKRKCACCGKVFITGCVESWAWKDGTDWFCRYSCMMKVKKERIEEREKKRIAFISSFEGSEARKAYIKDRNRRLIKDRADGMSLSRTARKYGISMAQVKNIYNSEMKDKGS